MPDDVMRPARTAPSAEPTTPTRSEIDLVLVACRALVAIAVRSLAAVTDEVDMAQLRILVVIASRGSVSLSEVADAVHIHLSKASRTCDRLVAKELIARGEDPQDRRHLRLTLTPDGKQLVGRVLQARRAAIGPVLARMDRARRAQLVAGLRAFGALGAEPADEDLWAIGWAT